ncbi:MAG: EamA family transporter [Patescibacteria group bacterium]
MSWLTIALTAYILLALVNVLDKVMMSNFVKDARVYTFLVGTFGLLSVVLAPLGLQWLTFPLLGIALLSGVWMFFGLHWFFQALSIGEASRVIPLSGASIPIFTVILAFVVLGDSFSPWQLAAIILLVAGSVLLTHIPQEHHWWHAIINRFRHHRQYHDMILAVGAGFAFALSFVLSKYVYDRSSFVSGLVLGRVGTFIAALGLLTIPKVRAHLKETFTHFISPKGAMFFGNQGLGALAVLLHSYAVSLGSVALVQALQGVQYAAVFTIAILASIFKPKLLKEYLTSHVLAEKSFAIILVIMGVAMIALF